MATRALGVLSLALALQAAARSPPVSLSIEASWDEAPLLTRMLHHIAVEDAASLLSLLDFWAPEPPSAWSPFAADLTEEQIYQRVLHGLRKEQKWTDATLESYELGLAAHEASPAIQAAWTYYETSRPPEAAERACGVFVEVDGRTICDPRGIPELLETMRSDQDQDQVVFGNEARRAVASFPFDIPLSAGPDSDPAVVFYADPHENDFLKMHTMLSQSLHLGGWRYILRWKPSEQLHSPGRLVLGGYGASLDIKKAEYLVIDDRPIEDRRDTSPSIETAALDAEVDQIVELIPLKAEEIQDIGPKAVQYIVSSAEPFVTLFKLSQDFPRLAHDLASQWVPSVSDELQAELLNNARTKVQPGVNLFWLNGMQINEREVDTFSLLRHIRAERRRVEGLVDIGLSPSQAIDLIIEASKPAATPTANGRSSLETMGQFFDSSDNIEGGQLIYYWNDLETDKRYQAWPHKLLDLLRPSYPGQMNAISRNLYNVILALDMSQHGSWLLLTEQILPLITRQMPIRFGLVPLVPSHNDKAAGIATSITKCLWYLLEAYSRIDAMQFLENMSSAPTVSSTTIREAFHEALRVPGVKPKEGAEVLSVSEVLQATRFTDRFLAAASYAKRLGLETTGSIGHAFLNGNYMRVDEESFRMSLQQILNSQMQYLQQLIYYRELTDDADVSRYFYDLPTTLTRRNALMFPSEDTPLRIMDRFGDALKELHQYIPWLQSQPEAIVTQSIVIVTDLDTVDGKSLVRAAMKTLVEMPAARIKIVHNPAQIQQPSSSMYLNRLMRKAVASKGSIEQLLASMEADEDVSDPEVNVTALQGLPAACRRFLRSVDLKPGGAGIILNGRIIAPVPAQAIEMEDIGVLMTFERRHRLSALLRALDTLGVTPDNVERENYANLVASAAAQIAYSRLPDPALGMFESTTAQRSRDYRSVEGNFSSISIGQINCSYIQIAAVLDPLSDTAQKWASLLRTLSKLSSFHISVWLNPRQDLRELPVKRFYRHVFEHRFNFDGSGNTIKPALRFTNLPESALLTMSIDVPNAWLAFPKKSRHDLDNIRLSDLAKTSRQAGVEAVFELEHLVIEGHARDMPSGQPPRGLQLLLAGPGGIEATDSLVMANLGYFQLKANPGVWTLRVREGRSSEVFSMESVGGLGFSSPDISTSGDTFAIVTLEGLTMYPRFRRRPGQEAVDLLTDDITMQGRKAGSQSLLTRVRNVFSSREPSSATVGKVRAGINIFTVASGLLYERMAMIMIVSVLRHTKTHCKFWFIQNFLSPAFKAFMPHMAAEYGFDYEFITFKWPHWLRTQKEKQRFIWGFKILFLDVLFPLELDRVIFVDSDQIVRTDLKQLVDLDLQGAPYAYTPMGDDREETEGFRFWKGGYWKEHLGGLPYHISALYVIDLDRFRAVGAGDRLRAQYQALSADPNSLANLDQDLPNNMQRSLPIYSLDRSWLWCETWCSDESLKDAKTIDLCNNPLTHELKLKRAKRLISEWTVYDDEIASLAKRIAATNSTINEAGEAFAANAEQLGQAKEQVKEFVEEGTGLARDVDAETAAGDPTGHLQNEL